MARSKNGSGVLIVAFLFLGLFSALLFPSAAYAVPSFARQTGMGCTACHTAFPQLNSFGRAFKLTGYTMSNTQSLLPPIAGMAMPSFTHTTKGLTPDDTPKTFRKNNNFALSQASGFWAGRLLGPYPDYFLGKESAMASFLDKFGAFFQATYDGVAKAGSWDNAEIRFADSASIHNSNFVYGFYVNNNPTLQDLWNTTPAWGFPFSASGIAPTPAAAPLIAGGVAQQVLGFGAYTKLFSLLYLDIGGYRTLGPRTQRRLGVPREDVAGETQVTDIAPYWRIAVEPTWGPHSLEFGTYGMAANTFPGRTSHEGKDRIADVGLDSQYQYSDGPNDITVLLNLIYEHDRWHASHALGNTSHSSGWLWNFAGTASYLFDKTYGVDFQYFYVTGRKDADLFAEEDRTGSPTSDGFVYQLDYLPFNKGGGPAFWPMSNVKFSLQYVIYNRFNGSRRNFDGAGRNARDNNTLYLEAWFAF
jgi:hypothetical protein